MFLNYNNMSIDPSGYVGPDTPVLIAYILSIIICGTAVCWLVCDRIIATFNKCTTPSNSKWLSGASGIAARVSSESWRGEYKTYDGHWAQIPEIYINVDKIGYITGRGVCRGGSFTLSGTAKGDRIAFTSRSVGKTKMVNYLLTVDTKLGRMTGAWNMKNGRTGGAVFYQYINV
jgi:hypothetical protein